MNVGEDTTLGDGDTTEEFVQLFVVSDGELEMSRDDSSLLVVSGSVSGQFENFSGKIFENGGEVDGCAGSDSFSVVAFSKHSVNSTDWELKPGSDGSGLCLCFGLGSFTFSGHFSKSYFFLTSQENVVSRSFSASFIYGALGSPRTVSRAPS